MTANPITEADLDLIKKIIPHRYPFLLIDKVRDIELNKGCVGVKNVTFNEPHFQGHFPAKPIMPGVLVVEAMAQAAAVLVGLSISRMSGPVTSVRASDTRWRMPPEISEG